MARRLKWGKEQVIKEGRKYATRSDFQNGCETAYKKALNTGWISEMTWLLPPKKYQYTCYCVYAYLDNENKVAYVGLTKNKCERHNFHCGRVVKKKPSCVFTYFSGKGQKVPNPIYLEENLTVTEAQIQEDFWVKKYKKKGYVLLNKAKTGLGSGSIGSAHKLNKREVFRLSKKYTKRYDFNRGSNAAYKIARENGWLDEMTWLVSPYHKWTKDEIIELSKGCKNVWSFQKEHNAAYQKAKYEGWLNEIKQLNDWCK